MNEDGPEPETWYHPVERLRTLLWYLRNPLHNFTFQMVGMADRHRVVTGTYHGVTLPSDVGMAGSACDPRLRRPATAVCRPLWQIRLLYRLASEWRSRLQVQIKHVWETPS